MRLLALVPFLLGVAALVLSFLALFAGYHQGFMEDCAIITLNTSRVGQGVFNTSQSSSNPILNALDQIGNAIEGQIEDGITTAAQELGLHDFYSFHILSLCEGSYSPNSTAAASSIHENVTACFTNNTAIYDLRPAQILQNQLDAAGHSNINVTELGLPTDLDKGLHVVRAVAKAMYALYIAGIVLTFLAVVLALLGVWLQGRLMASLNVCLDFLAFAVLAAASAIATAVGVKGADEINNRAGKVGIVAHRGTKFLAITWTATACMLIASIVWCAACVVGRPKSRRAKITEKWEE